MKTPNTFTAKITVYGPKAEVPAALAAINPSPQVWQGSMDYATPETLAKLLAAVAHVFAGEHALVDLSGTVFVDGEGDWKQTCAGSWDRQNGLELAGWLVQGHPAEYVGKN